jgi:hypothetical protein
MHLGLASIFAVVFYDISAINHKMQQHKTLHPEWQGEQYGKKYGGGVAHGLCL